MSAGTAPAPWTVTRSKIIVADRWIRLRADECVDAAGRAIAPYYVLEPSDWISVLAVDVDGAAIVVEEYRHGAGIVALGTIGGAVEADEEPRDAAARELREETGHEAQEIVDLGPTWSNFGNHTNRVHHFLARGCTRVADQAAELSPADLVQGTCAALTSAQLRMPATIHRALVLVRGSSVKRTPDGVQRVCVHASNPRRFSSGAISASRPRKSR